MMPQRVRNSLFYKRFGLAFVFLFAGLAPTALAQSGYAESFDAVGSPTSSGPSQLVQEGWEFRGQSSPAGGGTWFSSGSFQPADGTGYLNVSSDVIFGAGSGAVASNWMILPDIPSLSVGDELRFWTRVPSSTIFPSSHLEVRWSSNGGANTGSSASDVGDFDTLLLDVAAQNGSPWTEHVAVVPGYGRLAIRYRLDPAGTLSAGSFSIDGLTVGGSGGAGTLPGAGQTVTWTLAESPITLSAGLSTIPSGATVEIDPGVVVDLSAGAQLHIDGTLRAFGTVIDPVVFLGGAGGSLVTTGLIELFDSTVDVPVVGDRSSTILVVGGSFESGGRIETTSPLIPDDFAKPAFVHVDNTNFNGSGILAEEGTVVVENSTFTGGGMQFSRSEFRFENVVANDGPGSGLIVSAGDGSVLIDGISIQNAAGPGLHLLNGNALIGSATTISGCAVPVSIPEGGLLEGSVVPATGNALNRILVPGLGDRFYRKVWSDVGVPYRVEDLYVVRGGSLDIGAGVEIELDSGATIASDPAPFRARGRDGDPVIFRATDPAQGWTGLTLPHHLEYCEVSGAGFGVAAPSGFGHSLIENCVFRDNDLGVSGDATVRGTLFESNIVGIDGANADGEGSPNEFVANGTGVTGTSSATGNWWGDPSGPSSAQNPGGLGDSATAGVDVLPFLSAAPSTIDRPPTVRVQRLAPILQPGDRVMLVWEAGDDVQIASQRILFSAWGSGEQVVVDGLGPDVRSHEWTVPSVGNALFGDPSSIRIVATDSNGREGSDRVTFQIPSVASSAGFQVTSGPVGVLPSGSEVGDLCWTGAPFGTSEAVWIFEQDFGFDSLGAGSGGCIAGGVQTPVVSTDLARVAVIARTGSFNQFEVTYSEYYEVRPDVRLGDAPPSVTLLSPTPNTSVPAGSDLVVEWSGSDDRALRAFQVQASYDGGHTWHFVAEDLPPTATSFDWKLADGAGFADVRVRVVAFDERFQASSDTIDGPLAIVAAGTQFAFRRGDCSPNGQLALGDVIVLLSNLFQGGQVACADACDVNDDGQPTISDAIDLLGVLFLSAATLPEPTSCGADPSDDTLGCDAPTGCP